MKKSYFIGSVLLALSFMGATTARAQASYQPGYVVTLAGDTVRGQVQDVSARRNSMLCRFRPAASSPPTNYTPADLRAYGIQNGAAYRVRPVPPADSASAASRPVFLEVLVPGAAQLYSSRDQRGHTRYFVAAGGPDARLRELAERRVKSFANGVEAYETRSLYRDTLAAALRACPAVQPQLPRLPIQQAALVRVLKQYNTCVGSPIVAIDKPTARRPAAVLSVIVGYQFGALKLNSSDPFFNMAPPLRQTSPVAGLALNLMLPHTRRTVSLRLEATYAHEVYTGEYTGFLSTAALPTVQVNRYRFDLHALHVPILLRYTLMRSPRLRPFVEAGLLYGRLLRVQSAFSLQRGTDSALSLPFFEDDYVQYNQLGLQAGAGLSLPVVGERRLALLARVASSSGPSNYAAIGTPITRFSVLLGLDLSKP
jgi:hypothetical protein